ncbi:MAG: polyphosphate kinase 1 [Synergistaceae bacterium]|nr:polyphosphate kinase 1 [Synergistaceae bacterium]
MFVKSKKKLLNTDASSAEAPGSPDFGSLAGPSSPRSPDDPELYFNRELSWIEFNRRVLDEAMDPSAPLLEQVKFLSIFHNNLDEFFMVRVANLYTQYMSGTYSTPPDGMTPAKALAAIRRRVVPMLRAAQNHWNRALRPALFDRGVRIVTSDDLQEKRRKFLQNYYQTEIYPILTPQAIDPSRPFPVISNESLNVLVELSTHLGETRFARLKIPNNVGRFLFIPRNREAKTCASLGFASGDNDIVFLEDVICRNLDSLFPGYRILNSALFRITRNTDFEIETDEADDLLEVVRDLVDQRRFGEVVRLEIANGAPKSLLAFLVKRLNLLPFQIYKVRGPLGCAELNALCRLERPDLKEKNWTPRASTPFGEGRGGVYSTLRRSDLILCHPYDSFASVLDFLRRSAEDPRVIAIKQTLYRVGGESPIVDALIDARRNGKQVTAVVELKARFDEERNIRWADAFEDEGIHVVYGLVGMKIHAKLCLVLRREEDGIRRYVHIGTGNYNPATAKIYSDLGLFTSDEEICSDVTDLFNSMTGFARQEGYRRLLVSPVSTRNGIIERIEREIRFHVKDGGGRIYFKLNHLVDPACIQALYRASQAGVEVRLQVRGICCLRPGVPGVSDSIAVTSLVGRFLEHARIYYFGNGGAGELFIGSSDLMQRNLDRRVEVLVPILDPALRQNVLEGILLVHMADTVKLRALKSDGVYERVVPREGEAPLDSQQVMMDRETGWNPILPVTVEDPSEDQPLSESSGKKHRHGHRRESGKRDASRKKSEK